KDAHLDRFSVIHVLSREPRDVDLFSGRLDEARLTAILDTFVGKPDHAWLCGPFPLIQEARELLRDRVGEVHVELFYVEDAPPELASHQERPPSGPTSTVTIVLDGKRTTAELPTDQSVLDAAQRVRADLPFACKGGVCGTCRARITEGEVDMRRNYALEESEVADGFVLTCQSHAVSERVTVDFDA
ncbi:MAG: 2Fe-2S iron-sulfur cluster binding domain-containing protein, partial [Myxococcales bacterium]